MAQEEADAYTAKNISQQEIVTYNIRPNAPVSADNKVKTTILFKISDSKKMELFTWMKPQLYITPKKKKMGDSDSDEEGDDDQDPFKRLKKKAMNPSFKDDAFSQSIDEAQMREINLDLDGQNDLKFI